MGEEEKQTSGDMKKDMTVKLSIMNCSDAESSIDDSANYSVHHHSSSSSDELPEYGSSSSFLTSLSSPSSSSSSSFNGSGGPLYELSELIAQLPIKRGLSKFYDGKSQSFTSLAGVTSLDDLRKKESSYRSKRLKFCSSYDADLDRPEHESHRPVVVVSRKKDPIGSN